MGVDFHCGDIWFSRSYHGWNEIRLRIIKLTFDYIQDRFQREEELYKNITDEGDEHFIGKGSTYYLCKSEIMEIIKEINLRGAALSINTFINLCSSLSYVDSLIYFDISGIYALCNKNDCEGFYSVGNSFDICQLFGLIETFIEKVDSDLYSAIYIQKEDSNLFGNRLYDLFKESATRNKIITIS